MTVHEHPRVFDELAELSKEMWDRLEKLSKEPRKRITVFSLPSHSNNWIKKIFMDKNYESKAGTLRDECNEVSRENSQTLVELKHRRDKILDELVKIQNAIEAVQKVGR